MGADLITVVLAKPSGRKLDFTAAHAEIDRYELEDFDEEFLWVWGLDESEDFDRDLLLKIAHDAFNEVENALRDGYRYLNYYDNYLGSGIDLVMVGDRTYGDSPAGYNEFISVAILRSAGEAAGFVFDLSEWVKPQCIES